MTAPRNEESFQQSIDENPFNGMLIDNDESLKRLEGRYPCSKCGKSRKFFCYTCYVPVSELEGKLPYIKLPIKIDIIKHRNEIDGKSTAAHAAVLSSDVNVYTYPDIPDYRSCNVVLIYPSFNAVGVSHLFESEYENLGKINPDLPDLPKGHNKTTLMVQKTQGKPSFHKTFHSLPIDKAVFIDSTWNQSKGIFKDDRINSLPCVVLQNRISQFWRHQRGSPRWYLSTIEAIHQFLVEIHLNVWGLGPGYTGLQNCFTETDFAGNFFSEHENAYSGQYDNLLYFFKHMYKLIHAYYDHGTLYAYKRRLL